MVVTMKVEGKNSPSAKEGECATVSTPSFAGDSELVEDYLIEPEEMEFDYFKWLMTSNEPIQGLGGQGPLNEF